MTDLRRFGKDPDDGSSGHVFKRLVIVLVILVCGVGIAVYMIKTKPKAHKAPSKREAPLVECLTAQKTSHKIVIAAMGTVIPAASISLKSKVGGEVIDTADEFIPGGRFKKGQVILKIDPSDYDLDIQKKESLVNVAQANLDLESGRQEVARGELELMKKSYGREILNDSLALRKPQRDQAKAEYDSAMADLEAARLNLKRTVVKAPFNCMVLSRSTHKGAQVSSLEILADLVNTDAYWIEATVPVDQIAWLTVPDTTKDQGSPARILAPGIETPLSGHVIRIGGQLNDQSRLANILIQVDDPLGLNDVSRVTPLMLNDYVRVFIDGKTLDHVVDLPRSLLRDNREVWVLKDGKLDIRKVGIIWSDTSRIYIDQGLDHNDCVIQSNLTSVVNGMKLRSTADKIKPKPEAPEDQTP